MKKIAFLAGFVFLMVSLYAQNTSDFEIQGNDDGTMTILNYKGLVKDITIPEKIFNMPVSRLREGAFKNKGLTSVVIPNTVTFIGDETFSQNQLVSVTIPETLEYIGNSAFSQNRLTTVTIPGKVIVIGNSAFSYNQLTSVVIPDNVKYIGSSTFYSNQITTVTIGNGVLYIGSSAFSENNRITTIKLGNEIMYIGSSAFYNHRCRELVFPGNIVFLGEAAFEPYDSGILNTITIGKYVMLQNDNTFSSGTGNFDRIYRNNDKRSGKYIYTNNSWSFTP